MRRGQMLAARGLEGHCLGARGSVARDCARLPRKLPMRPPTLPSDATPNPPISRRRKEEGPRGVGRRLREFPGGVWPPGRARLGAARKSPLRKPSTCGDAEAVPCVAWGRGKVNRSVRNPAPVRRSVSVGETGVWGPGGATCGHTVMTMAHARAPADAIHPVSLGKLPGINAGAMPPGSPWARWGGG